MLCTHDLAQLMGRSESSVACFMGMARPRHVRWTPIRAPGQKNPTRYYELSGMIDFLSTSYVNFDGKLEAKMRKRSAENAERFGEEQ